MTYTISKIEVFNQSDAHMGDDCTEADAAGYRQWLTVQLVAEFSAAEVDVFERQNSRGVCVRCSDDSTNCDMGEPQDEVEAFLAQCWDRCPWDWVE